MSDKKWNDKITKLRELLKDFIENELTFAEKYNPNINGKRNGILIPFINRKHWNKKEIIDRHLMNLLEGIVEINDENKELKTYEITTYEDNWEWIDNEQVEVQSRKESKQSDKIVNFVNNNFKDYLKENLQEYKNNQETKKDLIKEEIKKTMKQKDQNKDWIKEIGKLREIVKTFIERDLRSAEEYRVKINKTAITSPDYMIPNKHEKSFDNILLSILKNVSHLNEKGEEKINELRFTTIESYWGRDEEGNKDQFWREVERDVLCEKGTEHLKVNFQDFSQNDLENYKIKKQKESEKTIKKEDFSR